MMIGQQVKLSLSGARGIFLGYNNGRAVVAADGITRRYHQASVFAVPETCPHHSVSGLRAEGRAQRPVKCDECLTTFPSTQAWIDVLQANRRRLRDEATVRPGEGIR